MTNRKKRSKAASAYWERVAIAQQLANEKTQEQVMAEMSQHYQTALKNIQGEVVDFHTKYAKDNQISYSDAVKRLSRDEKADYLKKKAEYEKFAKDYDYENMNERDIRWMREISGQMAITRLDAMEQNIQMQLSRLGMVENNIMTNTLMDQYEDNYYKGLYNVQVASGLGFEFDRPDETALKAIVGRSYDANNYSSDIWHNKEDLVKNMTELLGQHFARGTDIRTLSDQMAKRMGTKYSNAERLLRTESNYIAAVADMDMYTEAGLEQYEFVATLDNRTSTVCQDLDGKTFKVKDRKVGINCHPMHAYCRSTTVPYFDDLDIEDRIARDDSGKNYTVPGNMKYKEWAEKYTPERYAAKIGKAPKGVVSGRQPKDTKPNPNQEKLVSRMVDDVQDRLNDVLNLGPSEIRELLLKAQEGGFNITLGGKDSQYNVIGNRVVLAKYSDPEQALQVALHEMGHMIDFNFSTKRGRFNSDFMSDFAQTIDKEYLTWLDQFKTEKGMRINEVRYNASKDLHERYPASNIKHSGISDIFSAASSARVQGAWGHSSKYWKRDKENKPVEVFANMFQLYAMKDFNDGWAELSKTFPQSQELFVKMLDDMTKVDQYKPKNLMQIAEDRNRE